MGNATYTRLKSGDWGIRAPFALREGDSVRVVRKDGSTRTETVQKVVWQGSGVWLAAVRPLAPRTAKKSDCACDCDECSRRCLCAPHCNCRGGNVYDC